jgi:2-polyprenyl-3-methyl-5-hydroxy-6-metoxy-1,4-benzoquinol methylase
VGLATLNPRRPDFRIDLEEVEAARADGYGLAGEYRSREAPEYYVDTPQVNRLGMRIYAQPDVYSTAARVARELGGRQIIDVGCGDGAKLSQLHPEFEVVGVDFGRNIEECRRKYPFGTWIEQDLDRPDPIAVEPREGAVVISADVIEHLVDPDKLLSQLRALLDKAGAVVISTPDRERWRGPEDVGPPVNPAHVREWTAVEFARYLKSRGFERGSVGYTRFRTWKPWRRNIIALLR